MLCVWFTRRRGHTRAEAGGEWRSGVCSSDGERRGEGRRGEERKGKERRGEERRGEERRGEEMRGEGMGRYERQT